MKPNPKALAIMATFVLLMPAAIGRATDGITVAATAGVGAAVLSGAPSVTDQLVTDDAGSALGGASVGTCGSNSEPSSLPALASTYCELQCELLAAKYQWTEEQRTWCYYNCSIGSGPCPRPPEDCRPSLPPA